MRVFSAGELTRLRSTQDGAMQDTARRLVWTEGSADDHGVSAWTHVEVETDIACGVEHINPNEQQATSHVPAIDARIRLPIGTTLDERDRIKVTKRHTESLSTAQTFEIDGPVKRGPSGVVVNARVVTDGTE